MTARVSSPRSSPRRLVVALCCLFLIDDALFQPQFLSDLDLVFVDLIKELLKVDPHSRLGTTKRVRGHAWFQKVIGMRYDKHHLIVSRQVDFESVYARAGNVKPPYVPATDTECSSSVPRQLQFQLEVDLAFENF